MACPTHFFLVLSHIPNSVSPPSTPSSSSPHIRSHPDSLKNQSRPPRDINRTKANKLQDHSQTLMSRLNEATQEEEEALKSRQMSPRSPPTHTHTHSTVGSPTRTPGYTAVTYAEDQPGMHIQGWFGASVCGSPWEGALFS